MDSNEKRNSKWYRGGRPMKTDPAKNCVMIRFTDEEYVRFLTMYEESGVYAKSVFIKARVFNETFRVIKKDSGTMEYAAKLTQFYAQFRAIGVNYNQVVKYLKTRFSEESALAMLYRLERRTIELIATNQKVIDLSEEFMKRW